MVEKDIENKLKKALKAHKLYYVKIWGNALQAPGVPDVLFIFNGFFIGAEIKKSPNKPSSLQINHIKQINQCGGLGLIVDEFNINELITALNNNDMIHLRAIQKQSLKKYKIML